MKKVLLLIIILAGSVSGASAQSFSYPLSGLYYCENVINGSSRFIEINHNGTFRISQVLPHGISIRHYSGTWERPNAELALLTVDRLEGAVDYLSAYTLSQPKYTVQIREDNREIIFNHNTYVRLPQKNRLKYGDSCKRFPYLVKIIELFALDNFTYPASLDNVIDYWNVYKDIAIVRKELKAKYVKKIDEITFRKLENNKSDISLINTDTGFCMVYGCDTLFKTRKTVSVFPIPNRDLEYLPALNKYICYVSMHTADSGYVSITDEPLLSAFNGGLRLLPKKYNKTGDSVRGNNKYYTVCEVLEYSDGALRQISPSGSFDITKEDWYDEMETFVRDFAEAHNLSRIIFNYVHDLTNWTYKTDL